MQCAACMSRGQRRMSRTVYIGGAVLASSVYTMISAWRAVQPLNRITRRRSLSGLHANWVVSRHQLKLLIPANRVETCFTIHVKAGTHYPWSRFVCTGLKVSAADRTAGEVLCYCGTVYCLLCATILQCVSKKNIPDIFSCNSRKHYRIFIMFGTHVTEKVSNQ